MRSTQFFLPTLRENPTEAQIVSQRLMLRVATFVTFASEKAAIIGSAQLLSSEN